MISAILLSSRTKAVIVKQCSLTSKLVCNGPVEKVKALQGNEVLSPYNHYTLLPLTYTYSLGKAISYRWLVAKASLETDVSSNTYHNAQHAQLLKQTYHRIID